MGYTHYWNEVKVQPEIWKAFVKLAKKAADASSIRIAWEFDETSKKPEFNAKGIRFNGCGDNGHETFVLRPNGSGFNFCKTAEKPYDEIVVSILILAAKYLPGFSWSSDGDNKDFRDGLALAQQVDDSITETNVDRSKE